MLFSLYWMLVGMSDFHWRCMGSTIYDKSCNDIDSNSNEIFNSKLCGELILNTDGNVYLLSKSQYASRSCPENVLPSMIVFAGCNEDIKLVIQYATMCHYKISIRSGGHQYSGLSSCNSNIEDCIQIDLSHYNKIKKVIKNTKTEFNVGTGIRIKELNKKLGENNMFLPHGDCQNVGVGGHLSTGGQGHLHNQFGYILDHITGFDIILSNGQEISVYRPSNWEINIGKTENDYLSDTHAHSLNDLLYLAVLGGSPGSYGVVTNVRFAPLRDIDYSDTSIFYVCDWNFDAKILYNMLSVMQQIYNEMPDFNLLNVDYTFYIRLRKGKPWGANIRFIANYISISGNALNKTYFDRFIDAANAVNPTECNPQYIAPSKYLKSATVPFIFNLQSYKTRLQSTTLPLTDDFIDLYVHQMTEFYTHNLYDGIYIYSDITYQGGNSYFADPNNERTVKGRTPNLQVNTDIFWDEKIDRNHEQIASQWIENSWNLWMKTETYGQGTIDYRSVAVTFGNLDILEVWSFYYGDQETYNRLRRIKSKLDPINLFSNKFTVPPLKKNAESQQNIILIPLNNAVIISVMAGLLILSLSFNIFMIISKTSKKNKNKRRGYKVVKAIK